MELGWHARALYAGDDQREEGGMRHVRGETQGQQLCGSSHGTACKTDPLSGTSLRLLVDKTVG